MIVIASQVTMNFDDEIEGEELEDTDSVNRKGPNGQWDFVEEEDADKCEPEININDEGESNKTVREN